MANSGKEPSAAPTSGRACRPEWPVLCVSDCRTLLGATPVQAAGLTPTPMRNLLKYWPLPCFQRVAKGRPDKTIGDHSGPSAPNCTMPTSSSTTPQTRLHKPLQAGASIGTLNVVRHVCLAAALGCLTLPTAWASVEKSAKFYEDALARYQKNDLKGASVQLKNAIKENSKNLSAQLLYAKLL